MPVLRVYRVTFRLSRDEADAVDYVSVSKGVRPENLAPAIARRLAHRYDVHISDVRVSHYEAD